MFRVYVIRANEQPYVAGVYAIDVYDTHKVQHASSRLHYLLLLIVINEHYLCMRSDHDFEQPQYLYDWLASCL